MSIDMMTLRQAADCRGEIPKRWKSYRLMAIKEKQNDLKNAEKGLPSSSCHVTGGRSPKGDL
jgi:hypothetical protein